MKILFGGVRGSTPCAEPGFTRYGGHTTCLLVTGHGGELLLLDAGSGVRTVASGMNTATSREITVLLTHLHLDHLLGLPMLPALHEAGRTVTITGGHPPAGGSLQDVLLRLLSPPVWPFALEDFPAEVRVRELATGRSQGGAPALSLGGLEIRGVPVPHPNGCTAWRIDEPATHTSFVFATDMEWSAAAPPAKQAFLDLCREPHPIDLLVMDGHFAPEELADKAGWGHSSTAECVEVACDCGAGRLLITHHAPGSNDERLDIMADQVHRMWPQAGLAYQGLEVDLDASA